MNKNRRLIKIRIIILIILIFIILYVFFKIYQESKIKLVETKNLNEEIFELYKENIEISNMDNNKNISKISNEKIESKYLNFDVIAKLEIPIINLETVILKDYSKKALDVCATKFWGPNPNEIGNFCIVGHNYKKKNMFSNLINLKIGDEIYLSDNNNGKHKYNIYDIYKVKSNSTFPLEQETEGKKDVTLITCVNYTDNRLIIKSREM